ncbi:interaptin isoform X2 [Aethina tumida]|uniref:interaptin isoform X2 n=1 Tax=Aethina tumida TaxID=116153 RepID=UPI002147749A|nr:interaptin isoform X2 [Aethina tumida]
MNFVTSVLKKITQAENIEVALDRNMDNQDKSNKENVPYDDANISSNKVKEEDSRESLLNHIDEEKLEYQKESAIVYTTAVCKNGSQLEVERIDLLNTTQVTSNENNLPNISTFRDGTLVGDIIKRELDESCLGGISSLLNNIDLNKSEHCHKDIEEITGNILKLEDTNQTTNKNLSVSEIFEQVTEKKENLDITISKSGNLSVSEIFEQVANENENLDVTITKPELNVTQIVVPETNINTNSIEEENPLDVNSAKVISEYSPDRLEINTSYTIKGEENESGRPDLNSTEIICKKEEEKEDSKTNKCLEEEYLHFCRNSCKSEEKIEFENLIRCSSPDIKITQLNKSFNNTLKEPHIENYISNKTNVIKNKTTDNFEVFINKSLKTDDKFVIKNFEKSEVSQLENTPQSNKTIKEDSIESNSIPLLNQVGQYKASELGSLDDHRCSDEDQLNSNFGVEEENIKIKSNTKEQIKLNVSEGFNIIELTPKELNNSVGQTSTKKEHIGVITDSSLKPVNVIQKQSDEVKALLTSTPIIQKQLCDIELNQVKIMSELIADQQREISDLKLELNALQQSKASLELEISKKEEIIIKTQAESLKKEQEYKMEIKELKEKIKENSKLIEKGGSREIEEQLKEAKEKAAHAMSELLKKSHQEADYVKIVREYENTLSEQNAEHVKLVELHETVTRHLANLELAFSDVHQKYERLKTIVEGYKCNEETMKAALVTAEKAAKQMEERYEYLKTHAKNQIERSNRDILQQQKSFQEKENQLNAIVKRMDIKVKSIENALEQKTNECQQLAALCDQLTGQKL